jgi:hypothetical protein
MFIEIISSFFTEIVWNKIYEEEKQKYICNLRSLKLLFLKLQARKSFYNGLYHYYKFQTGLNDSYHNFLKLVNEEFFVGVTYDMKHTFNVFDNTIRKAFINFINYIMIHEVDNVLSRSDKHLISCKNKFTCHLSLIINEFTSNMTGKEITYTREQHKKLLEINKSLQGDLDLLTNVEKKSMNTIHTQTTTNCDESSEILKSNSKILENLKIFKEIEKKNITAKICYTKDQHKKLLELYKNLQEYFTNTASFSTGVSQVPVTDDEDDIWN